MLVRYVACHMETSSYRYDQPLSSDSVAESGHSPCAKGAVPEVHDGSKFHTISPRYCLVVSLEVTLRLRRVFEADKSKLGSSDSVSAMLQVLRQGRLLLFDQGETLLTGSQPHTQQVYIVLRGHVSMHLADGRSFLAGLPVSISCIAGVLPLPAASAFLRRQCTARLYACFQQ